MMGWKSSRDADAGAERRLVVLASRCLSGAPCRYHGRPDRRFVGRVRRIAAELGAEIVWACPEVLGGLPTPRPAVSRRRGRIVERQSGRDVTAAFREGARRMLELARQNQVVACVLFAKSPSCDPEWGVAGRELVAAGYRVVGLGDLRGRPHLFSEIGKLRRRVHSESERG